jgi:hypothetical protein
LIRIKLLCECGQRFAFEVEPINGRMPSPVACPACGTDKTDAANASLAPSTDSHIPAAATGNEPMRISIPAHPAHTPARLAAPEPTAPRSSTRPLPGQTGRAQAKLEAKARIMWGDPPMQVLAYLRSQGYGKEESSVLVDELVQERAATLRGKGIINIIGGSILICLPVGAIVVLRNEGYINSKLVGIMFLLGVYGIYLVVKGVLMLMAPKSISGDVEE